MDRSFDNPFADYGNIVRGKRFVGRSNDLRVVENRVIRPPEPGNLAIVGDYRIGKSSLIYKGVMEIKDQMASRRQLPIWINLATFDKASIFFRSLVTRAYDEMEDLGWLTEPIRNAANRVLEDEISWSEGYGRIQRFFEKVRQADYRILFVLDEFDHARHLFKGDVSGFQGLRELSYRPEWRVTFITTSRRSLREIELQTKAISTFDLIFHKHYLGMFNDDDMKGYFGRMKDIGIDVNTGIQERVKFYCGGHPFLLEMLGYELVELYRETGRVDVDASAQRAEHSLLDQYDHMISILSEDDSLRKLLQILFGPIVDVKQADVDDFMRYGLIQANGQDSYTTFSPHFYSYLKLVERQVDLWPVWRETELALRNCIVNAMVTQYGEQWIVRLENAHANLKTIFDKCQEAQQKEQKSFGSRASRNLIDFTYPQDLFAIIFSEWNTFKSTFGKDKNYWDQRSQLLAKIRNPLAHNRDTALYDYERKLAEAYCKEILSVLSQ